MPQVDASGMPLHACRWTRCACAYGLRRPLFIKYSRMPLGSISDRQNLSHLHTANMASRYSIVLHKARLRKARFRINKNNIFWRLLVYLRLVIANKSHRNLRNIIAMKSHLSLRNLTAAKSHLSEISPDAAKSHRCEISSERNLT